MNAMGYFLAGGNRNSWVKQVCFIGGYYTVVKHGYYQFKDFCCKKRGQVFIQVIGIFFCNLSILSTSPKLHGLIQHRSMTLHVCPHRLRRCCVPSRGMYSDDCEMTVGLMRALMKVEDLKDLGRSMIIPEGIWMERPGALGLESSVGTWPLSRSRHVPSAMDFFLSPGVSVGRLEWGKPLSTLERG